MTHDLNKLQRWARMIAVNLSRRLPYLRDDAIQASYLGLSVALASPSCPPGESEEFYKFTFHCVRNCVLAEIRRYKPTSVKKGKQRQHEVLFDAARSTDLHPGDQLEYSDWCAHLSRTLTPRQREIFTLMYGESCLNMADAARELNVCTQTVGTHHNLLLEKVRKAYHAQEAEAA